jgi:hypothetical protein
MYLSTVGLAECVPPLINMNMWKEILHILQTVREQNCFQFDQQYYKQTLVLAMGVPTLSVPAETYIHQWA